MKILSIKSLFATLTMVFAASGALAKGNEALLFDPLSVSVPHHSYQDNDTETARTESAFSPEAGSEALVLRVIASSERSIRLAAYSFTSQPVVKALLDAKKRGVDVRLVVDDRGNRGPSNIAAINMMVEAEIPIRTISTYAIHHDKYIISDERHVQNGSFNYSTAAAHSNSENVIVNWNNPSLAAAFLLHWQSRWMQGEDAVARQYVHPARRARSFPSGTQYPQ
ncbi:phospholipase D family protein [Herbaspirillum sp. RTI4]|uniref:phospholipase D family nuclease n=2 Tax=Pseudomonadati TaxID=3379134 RepID=UPI002AB5AD08|nr:phospholipase D family protein [Herbaspirillum sp. RTI4]MDY7578968.1 phospholipase D family protein [Herbaspirillum sp. RTI4]MEA9980899.1 phospholipase D family protein [Herbaspirillum sp. RTI4]